MEGFLNPDVYSAICEFCNGWVSYVDLSRNDTNKYEIGQLFECECGESKIWTNAVRHEKNLVKFLEGKISEYSNGFCNDLFHGESEQKMTVKVMTVQTGDGGYSRINDENKDADEKGILIDTNKNIIYQNNVEFFIKWYREHLDELKSFITEENDMKTSSIRKMSSIANAIRSVIAEKGKKVSDEEWNDLLSEAIDLVAYVKKENINGVVEQLDRFNTMVLSMMDDEMLGGMPSSFDL